MRIVLLAFSMLTSALSYGDWRAVDCETERDERLPFGAECGYFDLLENSDASNGRALELHFIRVTSIKDTDKAPLFFFAGGPGQASTALLPTMMRYFSDLLSEHDFVFVDQRGTGRSNPLECNIDLEAALTLTPEQMHAHSVQHHKRCVANYDADLTRYTTPYAVKDLEAVRRGLGYEKIFVWGGSYGSRVVLEYLRSFPDALAGAILDGVAPVAIQLPYHAQRDGSRSLDLLLRACEMAPTCASAFPELRSQWLNLLNILQEKPQRLSLRHPRSLENVEILLNDQVLSNWVLALLYSRELSPLLPLAMSRAITKDFNVLFVMASLMDSATEDSISEGMHLTVICAEDNTLPKAAIDDQSLLHLSQPKLIEALCALYPSGGTPPGYFQPFTRELPALILSGNFDPVTPPSWGQTVSDYLPAAKTIVVSGGHHIVSGLGCIPKLVKQFVEAPQGAQAIDASCVDSIKPQHFFIDGSGPALSAAKDGES